MKRRLLLLAVALVLLPVVGGGRLCWRILRLVAWFRPRTLLILGGLVVGLKTSSAWSAQFTSGEVGSLAHMIASWVAGGVGLLVLYHGYRSPWLRRFWRRARRGGTPMRSFSLHVGPDRTAANEVPRLLKG